MKPSTLYICRTFNTDWSPEEMSERLRTRGTGFLNQFMRGYASKIQSAEPLDPKHLPMSTSHQESAYPYAVICVVPEDQKRLAEKIFVQSGLTGNPEIDGRQNPRPLSEVGDNPIIICELDTDSLTHNLALFSGDRALYQGERTIPYLTT